MTPTDGGSVSNEIAVEVTIVEEIVTIVAELDYDLEGLGDRVRAARTDIGMTLSELAGSSGVSVSMLSARRESQ